MQLVRSIHLVVFAALTASSARAASTADSADAAAMTQAAALDEQSKVWERAEAILQARPAWARAVQEAQPSRSRSGSLVFSFPALRDADAATLLVARASRNSDEAFRRAVAEALPETKSPQLGALLATELALESSPQVRVSLAHALRYASDAPAIAALRGAAQDERPEVRETALASMRRHAEPTRFATSIVTALEDPEPRVQAAALRAWGSLRDPALVADVGPWLRAQSAQVRLAALRGLWRVDREAAQASVQTLDLLHDPAAKVARLARLILEAPSFAPRSPRN